MLKMNVLISIFLDLTQPRFTFIHSFALLFYPKFFKEAISCPNLTDFILYENNIIKIQVGLSWQPEAMNDYLFVIYFFLDFMALFLLFTNVAEFACCPCVIVGFPLATLVFPSVQRHAEVDRWMDFLILVKLFYWCCCFENPKFSH